MDDTTLVRQMLSFQGERWQFDLRAAAIALHRGHVLLNRAEPDDFWVLPGGRVELGETAAVTVVREMREETGLEVRVGRMVWIVENIFTLGRRRHHEVGFYYLVELPAAAAQLNVSEQFFGYEDDGPRLTFQWFPLESLEAVRLYPACLQTRLREMPLSLTHMIQIVPEVQNA